MSRGVLRVGLVVLAVSLVPALVALADVVASLGRLDPTLAWLVPPTTVALAIGAVPVLVVLALCWRLLDEHQRGDARSTTARALWRAVIAVLLGLVGYLAIGLIGLWSLARTMHPGILLAWLATQAVLLTCVGLAVRRLQDADDPPARRALGVTLR